MFLQVKSTKDLLEETRHIAASSGGESQRKRKRAVVGSKAVVGSESGKSV